MGHWYACRIVYQWELDDGEGSWSRELVRYDVVQAPDAEEAAKIAKRRQKPEAWGWYVWSTFAEECGSEDEARRTVRSWIDTY